MNKWHIEQTLQDTLNIKNTKIVLAHRLLVGQGANWEGFDSWVGHKP